MKEMNFKQLYGLGYISYRSYIKAKIKSISKEVPYNMCLALGHITSIRVFFVGFVYFIVLVLAHILELRW